ncbi:hypothetical protein [Aureliella helgolandensis]|uniref:hypothetical protein n=1 Tax=Aureliella helgolandensis TaxID=2527968 RepID=UPI0011A32116|nr:hypothetical protein [Aureliella helgolandensis]
MKKLFSGSRGSSESEDSAQLEVLPQSEIASLLPVPQFELATHNLARLLRERLETRGPAHVKLAIVGPAGSYAQEIVARWAEQEGHQVVQPPEVERLLRPAGDNDSLELENPSMRFWESMPQVSSGVLVIPHLERFFLRHHAGLDLLRQFTQWVWQAPCRVVVGCDSWAWAYLTQAIQIHSVFSPPIAMRAFDPHALMEWFQLIESRERPFLYRDSEEELFPPVETEAAGDSNGKRSAGRLTIERKTEELLEKIAVIARGNPGVACAIWGRLLCTKAQEAECEQSARHPMPVRVRALADLQRPILPPKSSTREAIVLHTLLLHRGLQPDIILQLVPFPPSKAIETLASLEAAQLIELQDGFWRVTLLAYPAVRSALKADGLLVDDF